jgi:hypothetical protein
LVATATSLVIAQDEPQIVARDLLPEDHGSLRAYTNGRRLVNGDRLDEPLASFESAQTASTPALVLPAADAASRVQRVLALPAWLRGPALKFAEQPFILRWLVAASGFVTALLATSVLLLRPGVEVGSFSVFSTDTPVEEATIREVLRDRLEHIGLCLQRPAGIGGAIGPALVVDTLLPSGGRASPFQDALAGLSDLAAKGGVPFAIGQVERVLGLLRRRRRYRVTGVVQLGTTQNKASANLTDLRSGRVLAHVSVSGAEADDWLHARRSRSTANPVNRTSDAVEILACKIWHALAEGTRQGLAGCGNRAA